MKRIEELLTGFKMVLSRQIAREEPIKIKTIIKYNKLLKKWKAKQK
jgi:hypothetical protein